MDSIFIILEISTLRNHLLVILVCLEIFNFYYNIDNNDYNHNNINDKNNMKILLMIMIKVMIKVKILLTQVFKNYLFIVICKWGGSVKSFQFIVQFISDR